MQQFSVLMSVYDKESPGNLAAALSSIIHQTMPPAEIVFMVDGPISEALDRVVDEYVRQYPSLFKIIRLPVNMGLGAALSIGLLNCSHELIARMDSDDISLPERFQKQIAFLRRNASIAVVGSNIEEFNLVPGDLKIFKILPENGAALIKYAKYRNPLNHPTIMFRKQAVLAAGNYSGEIRLFEDYMLYIRLLLLGYELYNIQESLVHFRIGNRQENIKRRSGLHYLRKELRFVAYAKQKGYLNAWQFLRIIISKPVVRLLPLPIVLWLYKNLLRKK